MHDVIVVGAGPAGLYTALRMAEEGLGVLVLEEHTGIGFPTHCTGVVSAETNSLYKIPDEIVLNRPAACLVVSPGGREVEFQDPGEEIAVLDRAGFDQALAASAQEAGAAVRTDCRVEQVETRPEFVEVVTSRDERVRARTLVLACGVTFRFHGMLQSRLPSPVLHTAQIELDATPAERLEIHFGRQIAPEGFAWLVPIRRAGRTRLKAGVLLRGDARAHLRRFLAHPGIASRLTDGVAEPVRRILPLGPARRSYAHRVLAVGDAAGLTKPVTGGGIFYSLLSAQYAAETLIEALGDDDLSARRLARYEARWRERLMPEIRTGSWFRRLLANLSDREMDTFVTALASDSVQSVIRQRARFNWHRSLILTVIKQPGIKSILLRSLFK